MKLIELTCRAEYDKIIISESGVCALRYNIKTGQVEISLSELCPPRRTRAGDDFVSPEALPETVAGSAPRDIVYVVEYGGVEFRISGRADALFVDGDGLRICELIPAPDAGSGKRPLPGDMTLCLAFMFCKLYGEGSAVVEVVMFDRKTGQIESNRRTKKLPALESVFYKRLGAKLGEAKMLSERAELVLPGAASVKFPFSSLREGQEIMMRECYDALRAGERLFIQAPTGIGKTMSALYPAVKFLGNGRCDKIFYLTAKISTQREAYRAAGMLFSAGAKLRTIVLSSKESYCLRRGLKPVDSPCAVGGCDSFAAPSERMTAAIWHLLALQNGYEKKIINKTAREFRVCPYELSLRLSEYCEIIIADYNYAFDPLIRIGRYFGDEQKGGRYVFLVDEAHNLADRTRSMYSAVISTRDFMPSVGNPEAGETELSTLLTQAAGRLSAMRALCRDDMIRDEAGVERGFYTSKSIPQGFVEILGALACECEAQIYRRPGAPDVGYIASLNKKIGRYLAAAEHFDERHLFFCEVRGEVVTTWIYCLDPSEILHRLLGSAVASVMFSATLTPLEYFSDILGGGRLARTLALSSPFDISNLFIGAIGNISTRYEDRKKTLPMIISHIAAVMSGRRGNYIAYFPSYKYMEAAASAFSARYPGVKVISQEKGMTRERRENFLDEFRRDDGLMRLGFCVLGGSFSEGIDLPGSRLIGVIVVGVGMPGLSSERNIMSEYYQFTRESGYDYAYTYPGMNNVLQAAGRVIRGESDRGVLVLIDDRYCEPKYTAMYPDHWRQMQYFSSAASLNSAICEFWKDKSK